MAGWQRGKLKKDDEEKIKLNYTYLLEQIDGNAFVDRLVSEYVFSMDDKEEVQSGISRDKRADKFLQKLLDRGPGKAFTAFMSILREVYPAVAQRLTETRVESETAHASALNASASNASPSNPSTGSRHQYEYDVCLTYSKEDEKLVRKLHSSLQSKRYTVWVDWENGKGNILDDMAEGVNKSAVVVICMSDKYFNNRDCKTGANYAYRKEKPIIPLLLQEGYTPTGWLDVLTGDEKHVDFTETYPYNESLKTLLKQLDRYVRPSQSSPRDRNTESKDQSGLKQLFDELDLNKDGKISVTEIESIWKSQGLKCTRKDVKARIKEIDKNGDGEIDFEEFVQAMQSC